MVGLILIYFVGKAFYDMAERNDESKWLYGILGVASYYGGIILGGLLLGILMEAGVLPFLADLGDTMLGLVCIPFGVLLCWGFYNYLKKSWLKKSTTSNNSDLLDS